MNVSKIKFKNQTFELKKQQTALKTMLTDALNIIRKCLHLLVQLLTDGIYFTNHWQ